MLELSDRVNANARLKWLEYVPLLVFLLTPFLLFLGSPVMPRLGVWYQSEPLTLGVLGLATLAGIGLVASIMSPNSQDRKMAGNAISHMSVILPAGIFLWSIALMPFVQSQALSFYGAPQTGVGAAWFLAIAVLTGSFRLLFASLLGKKYKTQLGIYVLVSAVAVTAIGVCGLGAWKPFFYPDYLAFVGLFVWGVVACFWIKRKLLFCVATVVCCLILIVSENRASFGAFVVMPIVYMCVSWGVGHHLKLSRILSAALPVAGLIGITFVVYFVRDTELSAYFPESVRNTLLSRALMLDIIVHVMSENPVALLAGEGWGYFSQALMEELASTKTSLFDYSRDSNQPRWRWDALWRLDFDSHNILAESILSSGIFGGVLVLTWIGCVAATARRQYLAIAVALMCGFVLMAGVWFQTPLSAPYMAMAFAAVSREGTCWKIALVRKGKPAALILAVPVIALAFAVVDYTRFAAHGSRVVDDSFSVTLPKPSPETEFIIGDFNRGQYHFAQIMRNYSSHIETILKTNSRLAPWQSERLGRFLAEADRRFAQNGPIHVGVRALNTRSNLVFLGRYQELGPSFQDRLNDWGKMMDLVLARFPQREDLTVGFHLWLLREGNETELLARSESLLARNNQSPIGLWFSGVVLLGDKNRAQEGIGRMRLALKNGIERVMPVDNALKKSIRAN